MKFKLINTKTNEEALCEKVTIGSFDYYVSDELPQKNDKILCDERNHITENPKYKIRTCKSIVNDWIMTFEIDGQGENPNWTKKIIATNNPNIDISKVVDEVVSFEGAKDLSSFVRGYTKAKENYQFTEEDMIEFAVWKDKNKFSVISTKEDWVSELLEYSGCVYTTKELLQLWKEQQPKIVYYE